MSKFLGLLFLILPLQVFALTKVDFAWDPPADISRVAGYHLCYGPAAGAHPTCADAKLATTFSLVDLPDGTWFFAAKSYGANGLESGWSNEVSIKLDSVPPGIPRNFRQVAIKVNVVWKDGTPIVTAVVAK